MRRAIIFALCILLFELKTYGSISEDNLANLVSAAWKTVPESMDISYTLTTQDFSKNEEQLTREYKKVAAELYPESTPDKQKEFIELNVRKRLESQRDGEKIQFRVRYDKDRQRIDTEAFGFSKTYIEISDKSGHISRLEYHHGTKKVFVRTAEFRDKYSENSDVPMFMTLPPGMAKSIKKAAGDCHQDGSWDPNEAKIERLRSGMADDFSLAIEASPEFPDEKIHIEKILLGGLDKKPLVKTRLVVDKDNYSKVYEYNEILAATGKPIKIEVRSKFDAMDFPHCVAIKEYNAEGNLKLNKLYEIENVQINLSFSNDVFEIDSKSYTVVEQGGK